MKRVLLLLLSVLAILGQHKHFFLMNEYAEEVNRMQSTWTAGYNPRWEAFTLDAIKSQMGTILDEPEEVKLPLKEVTPINGLPENFDSRV